MTFDEWWRKCGKPLAKELFSGQENDQVLIVYIKMIAEDAWKVSRENSGFSSNGGLSAYERISD